MVRGERRDLKKESFWREMVRGQSGSGLSVRAWCRRHALTEPAFYWWRRRLADSDATSSVIAKRAARNRATFVPVRVSDAAIVAGVAAPIAGAGRIEILLADGRRVHLIGPVDRQALADVLAVLTTEVCDGEARPWAGEACGRAAETRGNGRVAESARC